MRATEIRFQFQDEVWRTVNFKSDLSSRTLASLRKLLISQCAPAEDPSPNNWLFYVNDALISPMDAANRTIGNTLLECRLVFKGTAMRVPIKRARETQVPTFNLQTKLARILHEDISTFQSERDSNGLCHRSVIAILGHISKGIVAPVEKVIINTEDQYDPIVWIRNQKNANIAMCAYFVPYHVSLLCAYGPNRYLHLDASHSFRPNNQHLFDANLGVSYTYIPYQLFDDTNQDNNLAGGNCSMFTGLNAIACVLRYRATPVRFDEFWRTFQEVLDKTPTDKGILIRRHLVRNLLYHQLGMDSIVNSLNLPLPPVEMDNPVIFLNRTWLQNQDFISDYIMLTFFRDTSLGFHQVSLLGNVFRFLLQEIVQRGFVSSKMIGIMLCSSCNQIADSKCSECHHVYCSRECMLQVDGCV